MPFYTRRTTTTRQPRTTYPKKYVKKYPTRKYPLAKKNYQTPYELKQPTATTSRTAMQVAQYQTPLWPISKLIHNQLYYDYGRSLTSVAGTTATWIYSANGVYDPDITGTGHQAMGFDQMMLSYEHYAVIRSKLTVNFANNSNYPVRVGVYLSPEPTAITSPEQLMENGLVKTIILDSKGGTSTAPGVSGRISSISLDCDVKNYFGKQKYSQLLEDNYSGSAAAMPAEQVYFNVFAFSSHSGAEGMQVLMDALISYDTIYYEPRKLTPS